MKTVGVLALQGDFDAHRRALERAGADAVEVRDRPVELRSLRRSGHCPAARAPPC